MALLVGGESRPRTRAYDWCLRHPARRRLLADEDRSAARSRTPSGETNMTRVPRGRRLAPLAGAPRRARSCDAACGRPYAGRSTSWSACSCPAAGSPGRGEPDGAAVDAEAPAGRQLVSIYQALRAGVALAELMGDPQPEWELAGRPARPRAARAPRPVPGQVDVLDGLVLPGARRRGPRRRAARDLLDEPVGRRSSCPGWASAASTTNPWVTGAETCELVMALDALGDRDRALTLLADMQHLRARGRALLDRLRLPRRRGLAGRADDVHGGGGDPGRRRARRTPRRARTSSRRSPAADLGPSEPSDPVACGCEAPSLADSVQNRR